MLGALACAALLAFGVWALNHPDDTLTRVRQAGVVRVGYAPERPFAFRTAEGRVTGESPELARAVFPTIGVPRIEWVQTEFRALIPELLAGRFDVIAAGMYVTPERARQIAFSRPTFVAPAALLVRPADVARLAGLGDVRRSGAVVAVLGGAFEAGLASAAHVPNDRVVPVPDPATGLEAVRSGRVDAFALSRITLREAVRTGAAAGLAVVFPLDDAWPRAFDPVGRGAFGFRPDDVALRAAFDGALARMVGTPAHLRLVAPFGFAEVDLPPAARPAR